MTVSIQYFLHNLLKVFQRWYIILPCCFCKGGTVVKYISIKEASTKWGVSIRRVNLLCNQGRIYGAYRLGSVWAIPEDAKKPKDPRKTNKKE